MADRRRCHLNLNRACRLYAPFSPLEPLRPGISPVRYLQRVLLSTLLSFVRPTLLRPHCVLSILLSDSQELELLCPI